MTYIWNRAKRVDKKLMPKVVINCFEDWKSNEPSGWKTLDDKKRKSLMIRINREQNKMNESLVELGYDPYWD